jgi:hypothetical protein
MHTSKLPRVLPTISHVSFNENHPLLKVRPVKYKHVYYGSFGRQKRFRVLHSALRKRKKYLEFLLSPPQRPINIFLKKTSTGALCVWTWNDAKGDRDAHKHIYIYIYIAFSYIILISIFLDTGSLRCCSNGQRTNSTNKGDITEDAWFVLPVVSCFYMYAFTIAISQWQFAQMVANGIWR